MFPDIVESIMSGNDEYPRSFVIAQKFWKDFFEQHENGSDIDLKRAVEEAQFPFQWRLEREVSLAAPFAKSIMALTAIGTLYEDGFADPAFARRLIESSIKVTSLSGGVKSAAKDIAKMYSFK